MADEQNVTNQVITEQGGAQSAGGQKLPAGAPESDTSAEHGLLLQLFPVLIFFVISFIDLFYPNAAGIYYFIVFLDILSY